MCEERYRHLALRDNRGELYEPRVEGTQAFLYKGQMTAGDYQFFLYDITAAVNNTVATFQTRLFFYFGMINVANLLFKLIFN